MAKQLTKEGQEVSNELRALENLWYPDPVPQAEEYFKRMDELSKEVEFNNEIPEDWLKLIKTAKRLQKSGKTNKEVMKILFE